MMTTMKMIKHEKTTLTRCRFTSRLFNVKDINVKIE